MTRQDFKKTLIIVHDLVMTALAVVATFYVRFDGFLLTRAPAPTALCAAAFRAVRRVRLLVLPSLPVEMALRLPAGSLQHLPRVERARPHPAGGRLHPRLAAGLGLLLLRQDHHRALLADPDVLSGRPAPCLPLHEICAIAPDPAARRQHADAAARTRHRHRADVAGDRVRIGQEAPAQGRPVLPRGRSRPIDPRRAGARHLRRSRPGDSGFPGARRGRSAASWRRRARSRPRRIPTC